MAPVSRFERKVRIRRERRMKVGRWERKREEERVRTCAAVVRFNRGGDDGGGGGVSISRLGEK